MRLDYFIILTTILGISLTLCETLAHYTRIPGPILRKVVHVAMCMIIVASCLFFDFHLFIAIGLTFFVLMIISRKFYRWRSLADRADSSYGEILFPLGIAISAMLADTVNSFIISMIILGLSDTIAYIIGKNISSPKIIFNKTIGGSSACLVTSFIIFIISDISPAFLFACAITFVELISPYGSENLFLPIVTVMLLRLTI